jgi:hypothetical protein
MLEGMPTCYSWWPAIFSCLKHFTPDNPVRCTLDVPHQLQWSSSGQPIAAYGVSRPLRVYGRRMKTHGHCVNICTGLNQASNQVVFRIPKHWCCESSHANF